MKGAITPRQRELLQLIYEYTRDSGYSPTLEEMRGYLDVVSNQAVLDILKNLENKELIKKESSVARSIKILKKGYEILGQNQLVSFLGVTSAGTPLEAVEISGEWEITPEAVDVAKFKDEVFLLRVMGDSMVGAGIEEGDAILVQSKKEFVSGDVVLARIGNETTIKRFVSEDRPPYIYLKPENPKYSIIPFTDEMRLEGKVISVLKNGSWKAVK